MGQTNRGKSNIIYTEDIGRRVKYTSSYDNIYGGLPATYIVKSVQLYNRGLTDEEILNNYEFDRIKYNIN